ncbi:MAG: alanine racemase [Alphaproteobacteria bacterium]|nr:MAG: alanine racemase [Alphaproteobacteria bacterium]
MGSKDSLPDSLPDFPSDCLASLTINLGTLIRNYKSCIQIAGGTECAGMVKADAYGMGITHVAPALFHKANCRIFFVANLAEAIKLRGILPDTVIYVLNGVFSGHVDYFIKNNLRPVLNDLTQTALWQAVSPENRPACAIHFDTGINRLGLSPKETAQFINDVGARKGLDISLIMSHLACSDDPENPMNAQQLADFKAITSNFPDIPASLANSGGILLGPDYYFDLVRPGILMYGGNPSKGAMPKNIKVPFQILGKILQIRSVDADQSVGYGATWTAKQPRHIATINIGYGDGYPQMFNNCGWVCIKGMKVPVVGRVSMDMITVDVTGVNLQKIGPECDVELLGPHITLEMASEVSTLSQYEILTGVRERYQRIYI